MSSLIEKRRAHLRSQRAKLRVRIRIRRREIQMKLQRNVEDEHEIERIAAALDELG